MPSFRHLPVQSSSPTKTSPYIRRHEEGYVPRPKNAFILFRSMFYANQKHQNRPNDQNDISVRAARRWKELNDEQRRPFQEMAESEKREHRLKYPDYSYAPKSPTKSPRRSAALRRTQAIKEAEAAPDSASVKQEPASFMIATWPLDRDNNAPSRPSASVPPVTPPPTSSILDNQSLYVLPPFEEPTLYLPSSVPPQSEEKVNIVDNNDFYDLTNINLFNDSKPQQTSFCSPSTSKSTMEAPTPIVDSMTSYSTPPPIFNNPFFTIPGLIDTSAPLSSPSSLPSVFPTSVPTTGPVTLTSFAVSTSGYTWILAGPSSSSSPSSNFARPPPYSPPCYSSLHQQIAPLSPSSYAPSVPGLNYDYGYLYHPRLAPEPPAELARMYNPDGTPIAPESQIEKPTPSEVAAAAAAATRGNSNSNSNSSTGTWLLSEKEIAIIRASIDAYESFDLTYPPLDPAELEVKKEAEGAQFSWDGVFDFAAYELNGFAETVNTRS